MSIYTHMYKLNEIQQERRRHLLQYQQMEREILSHKQDCVLKALDLSVHDQNNVIKNTKDMPVIHKMKINAKEATFNEASMLRYDARNSDDILKFTEEGIPTDADTVCENYEWEKIEDLNHISVIADNTKKGYTSDVSSQKEESNSNVLIGKPLLSDLHRCVLIDDMPLPSSKQDFQTLLEEELRKESKITSSAHTDENSKPKKAFLKKGQGLTRYKSIYSYAPNTRRFNTFSSCNIQCANRNNDSKKYITHKDILLRSLNDVPVASEKQQQLNSKISSLRKGTLVESESISPVKQVTCNITNQSNYRPEVNVSDLDSKADRELEEVRLFEYLEEKAENSSFCSTSSTVLAFLQQSTPFKKKKELNHVKNGDGIVMNMQQQDDLQRSDNIEREWMVQSAHIKNSKSSIQPFEQVNAHIKETIIDSYLNAIDNMQEETQGHLTMINQMSQDNEEHMNHSRNHDISIIMVSDNDEKKDVAANDCNLAHDSKTDANHRVRFSKYNEYRTIFLTVPEGPILKDYFEQKNWDDCSVDISESSDDEEKLPLNYERSSLKCIGNENAFLQQDTTNDTTYYRVNVPEEEGENISSYKDNSLGEDVCCDKEQELINKEIDQVSEDEQSVLLLSSSSPDIHRKLNMYEDKECTKDERMKLMDQIAKMHLNTSEINLYSSRDQVNTCVSEHVKCRLLELEKEINIFRKESSALVLQRQNLQEKQTMLRKEYMEKEKNYEENKKRVQNQLEKEKKKLARIKAMMENRIRDTQEKAKQNKMERQKAQNLQVQLETLRDELNIKESRWNAAESRYKSEIRVLRAQISKLKQEAAELRERENVRRLNVKNARANASKQIITKSINQINKSIVKSSPKMSSAGISKDLLNISWNTSIRNDDNDNNNDKNKDKNRPSELIKKAINMDDDFEIIEDYASVMCVNKTKSKQVEIRSPKRNQQFSDSEEGIVKKKRYLYQNLLKDAISPDLMESEDPFYTKQYMNDSHQSIITQMENSNVNDGTSGKSNDISNFKFICKDFAHATAGVSNAEYRADRSRKINQNANKENIMKQDQVSLLEKNSISPSCPFANKTNSKDIKEIKHLDGHVEHLYPNGNIKKIYPDRKIVKTIYYNGDVCEVYDEGKERYFYATTQTWHTTNPDGLQILEFSNGQVEERMTDGTVKVTFPDGILQVTEPDGTKKVSSPDGTIVQTFTNGDRILFLPNGQKEVHTGKHKRREYPDGTVKTLYPDGTQETYYSNGRKRVKDKDGNLLIDTLIASSLIENPITYN